MGQPSLDSNDVNGIIDLNIDDDSFDFIFVVVIVAGIIISLPLPPSSSSSDSIDNEIDSDPCPSPSACRDYDDSGPTSGVVQEQVSLPISEDDAKSEESDDDKNADGERQI